MAIEYRLILAGDETVERVAERAFPDPADRPAGPAGPAAVLVAFLYERYGFEVRVRAGRDGYFEAESDGGDWLWEPAAFVAVTFRLEKDGEPGRAVRAMLAVVGRVVDSGSEDMAFLFNGDWLLLDRRDGNLVRHRRDAWWHCYTDAAQ